MRAVLALLGFLAAQEAAAQMFKCTDAAGKTTYSSSPCSTLGLKDAGEVRDRLQITPAPPPMKSAPRARNDQEGQAPKPAATAESEKKPERRCFTVHLAGGKTATRCNDKTGGEE